MTRLSAAILLPVAALWLAFAQTPNSPRVIVTHGPILGRPGTTEMGVWVRTSRPASFRVRYGVEANRMDQLSDSGTTSIERDNTGWLSIRGLKADTKYSYQVVLGGVENQKTAPDGSFRTLPDGAAFKNDQNPRGLFNLRFEYACGNSQGGIDTPVVPLPAYDTMLQQRLPDKVNFAILNGDWLYERARDYLVESWLGQVGLKAAEAPKVVQIAPTIVGVWENYKSYLTRGKSLSAWHRVVPSYFTIDDHEIINDVYGSGTPGRQDRKAVFRDIGAQAWYDYLAWSNPVEYKQPIHFGRAQLKAGSDVLTDNAADFAGMDLGQAATLHVHWRGPTAGMPGDKFDKTGGHPNAGVYEIVERLGAHSLRIRPAAREDGTFSYSIGRLSHCDFRVSNAHFFLLDTRTHREMHDARRPDKPGLSMLGKRQKAWLMDAMKKSDADFFFVVSSVNLMIPHVGGTPGQQGISFENKDDAWTTFVEEREQLIKFWDSLGKPVMVLTGDLHNSFAIKITDRVWEFASGPHNSRNHPASSEANRQPTGVFNSRGRQCDIRWSTYFRDDVPPKLSWQPVYTVVQVNNVFSNPGPNGEKRWVAFPRPQVVFQFHDGFTGDLLYAESIVAK